MVKIIIIGKKKPENVSKSYIILLVGSESRCRLPNARWPWVLGEGALDRFEKAHMLLHVVWQLLR